MPEFKSRIVGETPEIGRLRDEIARVAASDAKVLITGESGAGKELVAADIHALSVRSGRKFIPVNCAGLPETLLESELFGHTKGSFTGAYRDKAGVFQAADGGTVFFDEIGEMTLRMQGLVLRFLETGELQKIGAERAPTRVDVRLVAATNRDLQQLVAAGTFREDLFYRLNVIVVHVPPLRQRRKDVAVLAEHFLRKFLRRHRSAVHSIDPAAIEMLTAYHWPGNVRELENAIERLVVTCTQPVIGIDDLPPQVRVADTRDRVSHDLSPADDLFTRLRKHQESFWTTVYPLYMDREITRSTVRDVVRKGLTEARGNYKIVASLFNLEPDDYKRFLRFLRKHKCQVPFKEYRC